MTRSKSEFEFVSKVWTDPFPTPSMKTVCDYVHLNPARARLLRAEQALSAYRWSSYPEYLKTARRRPGWLRVDRLLGEHGISKDCPAGRGQFAARMEERRGGG